MSAHIIPLGLNYFDCDTRRKDRRLYIIKTPAGSVIPEELARTVNCRILQSGEEPRRRAQRQPDTGRLEKSCKTNKKTTKGQKAMFGKKKTAEDLLELYKELSEEERAKFDEALGKKPDTTEEVAEAKDDIAEKGKDTQTEKDRVNESVAAQEEDTGTEDTQTAKDRVDEAEGEDKAKKEEETKPEGEEPKGEGEPEPEQPEPETIDTGRDDRGKEVLEMQSARMDAVEAQLAELVKRFETLVDNLDRRSFGGAKPSAPTQENDREEMSDVMRNYYARAVFR